MNFSQYFGNQIPNLPLEYCRIGVIDYFIKFS